MKKVFFCFIFAIILGRAIFSQQPVIAKAPPMAMINPLTPDEAGSVGGVYDALLAEAKNVRFISQLVLDKGMRDYQFQAKDWANAEKTIALGEVLNIGWVVRPQMQKRVSRDESVIIVTAVLLEIQTQKITCATPVVLKNVGEARTKIGPLISEIAQIVNGGSGGLPQSTQSTAAYKVGDRGPAGGWVYYDKGAYSDGWRYLEVAPRETETTIPVSKIEEKIKGTDTIASFAVGLGKQNTDTILASDKDYQIIKAAGICAALELNWFKDWFLPSRSELSRLATTPSPEFGGPNLGGFSVGYYWSSSTYSGDGSVRFGMPIRNQQEWYVRAVHTF
jgi:hypothetical protein